MYSPATSQVPESGSLNSFRTGSETDIGSAPQSPAVTLAFAVRGDLRPATAATYAAVQIAGGIVGTGIAHLMFGQFPLQLAETVWSGPGPR